MAEQNLPELSTRQEQILSLLIQSYSDHPEPVSSKYLAEHYSLGFSSATIRNEMAVLEDLGYVFAPHTSAGRIPTESGYRYFVKRLIKVNDLTLSEQRYITERFQSLQMATEQWMRVAASVLSRMVRTASIVTPPIAETSRFKHIELISIQGRLVLLVVVLHGGTVHQRMLTLADPVPQPTLSEAATRLNSLCLDLYADEIRMKSTKLDVLAHEIAQLVADVMDRADSNQLRVIYREGLSEIISAFPDGEGAQQAVRLFEERAFLNMILSDFLNDGVQVIVAGENRWDELSQLSMVLSRYGVPGQMTGAVGVLGPTHINYGRAIGTVRYVSTLMTNMLVDLYQGGTNDSDRSEGEYPA